LESGRDVRVQTCVNKYESVPKESGPVKKGVSTCPRSRQVVNRSRIGKCSNHYRLIMKAGRMKNHGVRIMYALQPLSTVLYMRGCAMENLQSILKHPVAMNSVFLGTFPPPACSVINSRCSACILFANRVYALFVISSRKPRLIEFSALGLFQIHACKTNMVAPWKPPKM
jgi:hypothetical protein